MKILFNLLIIKILTGILVAFLVYEFGRGNLNTPLKYALEYYMKLKDFEGKINNLKVVDGKINIDKISLRQNEINFTLQDITIIPKFTLNYTKSSLSCNFLAKKIILANSNDQEFLRGNVSLFYENNFLKRKTKTNVNLDNVIYQDILANSNNPLNISNGAIKVMTSTSRNKVEDHIEMNFNDNNIVNIYKNSNKGDLQANILIKNLPIMLYKPLYYLKPNDDFFIFLNEFVKDGLIETADFSINLLASDIEKNNYNQDNINGIAKISKLKLLYHKDLPALTNMQIEMSQKGLVTEFRIISGNSTDLIVHNGLILMHWNGHENTKLLVTAKAYGPVKALTDFIASPTKDVLQKGDIDLTKFTGNTSIDIAIEIPLKYGTENIYDIRANAPNSNLSIFKNQIDIKNADLFAQYNGKILKIEGISKINEFNSKISFIKNFVDAESFDHKLNIITNLEVNNLSKKYKKIGFITLRAGSSKLEFDYINIKDKGKIFLNSDFKNLDLYFDKLGIHKNKGEAANFTLKGEIETLSEGYISFILKGVNNLNIEGDILLNNNNSKIIFNNLNHNQTKLKAKILSNKNLIDINIKGSCLDLSNADMFQFLEKEKEAGVTKLQLMVDKINLKNNVELDNLKLRFECNEVKCYKGSIKGNLGSKQVDIGLQEGNNFEEWLITTDNAGALLLGLGMYEDMRAGSMNLHLRTNRKVVKVGEIIPILIGNFEFNRFVLHDAPSLSKLVSVASLPGVIGIIRGNKDIIFHKMTGDFTFQEGILKISNTKATGPFFDFTITGNINTINKALELKGYVTPALYGASAVIGSVPIIGKIFTGDKTHRGIMSAPYAIKEKY